MGRGYLHCRFIAGSSRAESCGTDCRARHHRFGNRFYVCDGSSICFRTGSAAVARHAHRFVPVRFDRGDRARGSRRLSVGLTTGLETDVWPRRSAYRFLPDGDSDRSRESTLAFRACAGKGCVISFGLLPDYKYLFYVNKYIKPAHFYWPVLSFWWSFHGGLWVDRILIPLAGAVVLGTVFAGTLLAKRNAWGRKLLLDPVFGASVWTVGGYIL